MLKLLKLSFKSITVVEINREFEVDLIALNDYLGSDAIIKKELLFIVRRNIYYDSDKFLPLFESSCQNTIKLFGQQSPIGIKTETNSATKPKLDCF